MIHIPNMRRPRRPPGPAKRFKKYFTIPITEAIKEGFEKAKWRMRLDKTEVARRIMEYFLTLPAEDQDKIISGFDSRNSTFKRKPFVRKVAPPKLSTAMKISQVVQPKPHAPVSKPGMKLLTPVSKPSNRNGLD